ncbi:DUF904 domain-containing protein [Solimicrobium silvestre]|uniref:DUF904 domain-containing protein n=1 Tax=Solimicrobium silvestre TaxID=2099400 RepID=A0A2S9GWK5_9BURK|nr:DUF904 domain-containing protein [Solimicrobium silvestre]PRC92102.1 hypothetical protein S2091_3237 [Solimicrobium silvestre]
MISEFQQLAKKVDQLATLTQTMRGENTDLRHKIAELTATNAALSSRIQEAHERVTALLEKLPSAEQESE